MRTRFWGAALAIVLFAHFEVASVAAGEDGQRGRSRARAADQSSTSERPLRDGANRGRGNGTRIYQDPASTAGYESGRDLGLTDGRNGERYDPVRHKDYRDAERGYTRSYGSKDAYKTNFRSGFRQGYEDGYREGSRTR